MVGCASDVDQNRNERLSRSLCRDGGGGGDGGGGDCEVVDAETRGSSQVNWTLDSRKQRKM